MTRHRRSAPARWRWRAGAMLPCEGRPAMARWARRSCGSPRAPGRYGAVALAAAASPAPSAISRPILFAVRASAPSRIATMRPRYMTPIRSDSSSTSSSSAETSSIAVPASRLAIAWRWMNSMLPTSRPRVGWSRTSRRRSPSSSRATTTFCWLPPESVPAVTCADGVRTSNSGDEPVARARGSRPRRAPCRARREDGSSR